MPVTEVHERSPQAGQTLLPAATFNAVMSRERSQLNTTDLPDRRGTSLNANQARRIAATFSHIDDLLQNVERVARAQPSAFSREQADLSETEARLLLSLVETARVRMLAAIDHLNLPRPKANNSARWSITTAFRFIDIALADLTPQTLAGYGSIDTTSGAEVSAVASELSAVIERGRALLYPREGEQLRARVAKISGPLGDVLRQAEGLSTRLGVVEVRPLIAAAAERAETSTIDIGVFGRVSSGKSSLINALIGAPLLPVGATPVTAIPLRVVSGSDMIRVFFLDGREQQLAPNQLVDFATESGNHDNARGVRSILIQTPSLPEGLALLDTPGVGSLSQSGPAQAFGWLPRCDLGLVLVAAGSPLGRDELALVNGLVQAGIAVQVLLSKSDLIPDAERVQTLQYVRQEIGRSTGAGDVGVRAISVAASDRHLLDDWRTNELIPLVAKRQRATEVARRRRMRALLGAFNTALAGHPVIERASVDSHRARVEAEREIGAATDDLHRSARASLATAAEAATTAWRSGTDARAAVRSALLDAPNQAMRRARVAADSVLDEDGDVAGTTVSGEAASRIPPLFDPPFLDALPVASKPSLADRMFSGTAAGHRLDELRKSLDDAYGTYANRIRAWALERLSENFQRVGASRQRDLRDVAPELRALAAIIDDNFPDAG